MSGAAKVPSLVEVLSRARGQVPGHPAVATETETLTYEALAEQAGRVAAALRRDGVEPGDRVALLLNGSPLFITAYLGAVQAGAVVVPLDPLSSANTLGVILPDCEPRAVFAEAESAPALATALPLAPSVRRLYLAREDAGPVPAGVEVATAASCLQAAGPAPEAAAVDPDDVTLIVYTSGTTDVPKGVMLTHRNLAALWQSGIETFGLGPDHRVGHVLPPFHLYGLREFHAAIAVGGTTVLTGQAAFPASLLGWFGRQRITAFPAVPGHFSLFLGRYRSLLAALDPHLRYVLVGTAPTSAELLEQLRAVLPTTRICKTYGLTECGRVTTADVTSADEPFNSVGLASPGVRLSARDADGGELPRGQLGRMYIESDMVMKGYWRRPQDTAEVKAGACFKTRDLGYVDEAGRVYLVGRADQMINTGGEKTAPWEVEMALRAHPAVTDAAVMGMPDRDGILGEVPKGYVVLARGSEVSEEALRQHCARLLEPFKVPRQIVFLPQLPKTSLGKTSLQALRSLDAGSAT